MKTLIERLAKLIGVKTIVTLAVTGVFCVLSLRGTIDSQSFITIFTIVIGFYFGTQAERKKNETATVDEKSE